ncbi:SAM-dependent methyltransferase [Actinokineospora sp.]|uniref:SAM-dependent methyltransferase n=1 Tax=Actinokineospora sp. TaxID=1872133 RepID=UPI003D6B75D7
MDLPRSFTIRESSHRVLNPITPEKLATMGRALRLPAGTTALDLCCGKGELLCTWARDHAVTGVGVDISTVFLDAARERAVELGVADRVAFRHDDAAGFVADEPVDLVACVGATWIGEGVTGTVELLDRSLRPGGLMLIGEPYWRLAPPDQATVEACYATEADEWRSLSDLVAHFNDLGWDVVEMVLADGDSWDRYVAAQWLNVRRWLDDNPYDELAPELRADLSESQIRYTRYLREYLGWGLFALMKR